MIIPLILAGGSGSRLWPLSRAQFPKQFTDITGKRSLLDATLQRALSFFNQEDIYIAANQSFEYILKDSLAQYNCQYKLFLEPVIRNTLAAIAGPAIYSMHTLGKDPIFWVLPTDHVMEQETLIAALPIAIEQAKQDKIVMFAVQPRDVETGYGYCIPSEPFTTDRTSSIALFKEKPTVDETKELLNQGALWNTGMYVFKASVFLEEMQHLCPDTCQEIQAAISNGIEEKNCIFLDNQHYIAAENVSFEHGLLEKTQKSEVVLLDGDWSDVGTWPRLWQQTDKDQQQNVKHGDIDLAHCVNCYVHSEDRLVIGLGLKDLFIVDTPDALLVSDRTHTQIIKQTVQRLDKDNRRECQRHTQEYKPWGSYISLEKGENFEVKRLCIKPGKRISLQKHFHRSETWVIVQGCAKVTKGEQLYLLKENESIHIPPNTLHRLENIGKEDLHIIETQTGETLSEDDIIRYEDDYHRRRVVVSE